MAERRMFAKTIVGSDDFLDMPTTAQLLYFHLGVRADDDGFINNARTIMRIAQCNTEDLDLLVERGLLIAFDNGIYVIKDWKIHNYIQKDRYKETKYKEEKARLGLDENKSYTVCIQSVDNTDTQDRLGKGSLDKESKEEDSVDDDWPIRPFTPPSVEDVRAYCKTRNNDIDPEYFVDYYTAKGWMDGASMMQDWQAKIRTWERNGYNRNKGGNNGQNTGNHAKETWNIPQQILL